MSMGAPLPHDSARHHVTGAARYTDDIALPRGTLHLAFGLSTIAHGHITTMDLSAVRTFPGVVAVITAEDLDPMPDCSTVLGDEPLLTSDLVEYHSRPLFLIIADSHLAARKAARLARIEYRELPAILTIDDALAADARFEGGPVVWSHGDAAAAIAAAPHRVEGTLEVGGQEHFYLEGQVAAALPQEDGGVHVLSSTQHPTEIQHKVAEALGLPMSAVRVETRRMGGGFGGKESQGNWPAIACAIAARHTGRPCKMRYDRDDDMAITGKRHDIRIRYRAGYDDEGRVRGVEFTHLLRCGWSQDLSQAVGDRAMLHAENAYWMPDIRIESHRLRTNTASNTAFRGFGGPQGIIGAERLMDHIAFLLRKDPVEIRRANYYAEMGGETKRGPGSGRAFGGAHSPARAGEGEVQTTPYGMKVEDFIGRALTDELQKSAEYDRRKAEIAAWNAGNPIIRRGIGFTPVKFGISFTATALNQAGALVHVYQDGSIHLNHGGTEMGQGLNQKVAQVVASVFGVDPSHIAITAADTGKVPNTSATSASTGSDLNGMAARAAAVTLRDRIAAHLAEKHQTDAAQVRFENGRVRAGGADYTFGEVAAAAHQARVSLSSTGFYATPHITWDRLHGTGRPFFYFAYGMAIAEVAIDTLSGEYRILRADILHDTGTSLNPAIDIGQVEGAFVQAAGWLTSEELVWDGRGRLMTHAPSTYKIPACSDRPAIFNVKLWGMPNREDSVGKSKAVGEPPFNLGISVFLALSDAVASCGDGRIYPDLRAPATPEAVLAALDRVRGV